MSNDYESFSDLPIELQAEALREGEERIKAQLAIATASDARALAWGGLLVAAITASIGAGLAMLAKDRPDYILALVALGFGMSLLRAATMALDTVRPRSWHLPGSLPSHWLPEEWSPAGSDRRKVQQARAEQAQALSEGIEANAACAAKRAREMNASFHAASTSLTYAGLALFAVLAFKYAAFVANASNTAAAIASQS